MYNPSCDSYIASTLNQSSFDQWPLAYATSTQPEVANAYIPVPETLGELQAHNLLRQLPNPAVQSLEYARARAVPTNPPTTGRNTRARSRAAVTAPAPSGPAKYNRNQVKKLRKSENQIEVLKKYFKTNSKPGRENVSQLAQATGLKFLEVRNWFRNARLRNKDQGMNNQPGGKNDEDSCGEVSSSTGHINLPMDNKQELCMLWERLENEERKKLLPKYLSTWEKDSPERTEVIRALLKCLTTTERNFVLGAVKPRGPYRCSSDKSLSKTTILERAKNAWKELERMFGANKPKNANTSEQIGLEGGIELNLDRDMLEGLKSLFQAHRDYLYYLVKEMGIDTSVDRDMGKLKSTSSSSAPRYGSVEEDNMFIPHPQYSSVAPGTMDMLQPYTQNTVSSLQGSSPYQSYPIMPATPTPLYPTGPDFMNYNYTHSQHSYPQTSPLQFGGASSVRSPWAVPALTPTEERTTGLPKPYYPGPETTPDYTFVKNHFSPEKLSNTQPDKPKPLSEVHGGMSFNYNSGGPNAEITQKCTLVKYYEVCTYNKTCPPNASQPNTSKSLQPLQPLPSLPAPATLTSPTPETSTATPSLFEVLAARQ